MGRGLRVAGCGLRVASCGLRVAGDNLHVLDHTVDAGEGSCGNGLLVLPLAVDDGRKLLALVTVHRIPHLSRSKRGCL